MVGHNIIDQIQRNEKRTRGQDNDGGQSHYDVCNSTPTMERGIIGTVLQLIALVDDMQKLDPIVYLRRVQQQHDVLDETLGKNYKMLQFNLMHTSEL